MKNWIARRRGAAGFTRTSRPSIGRDERGATIVEFALVTPLILLLVLGTIEYGLLFKDWLTVSNATREGVRVGAALGDDINADCEIIKAVVAGLVASDVNDIQDVRIYEDDGSGNPVPANTEIWTYGGGDPLDCGNWGTIGDWPASDRDVVVSPGQRLDIIGVQIRYTHNWITNFGPFAGTSTIDESTISRLEPQAFE